MPMKRKGQGNERAGDPLQVLAPAGHASLRPRAQSCLASEPDSQEDSILTLPSINPSVGDERADLRIDATIVGPVVELRYASHGEAVRQLRLLRAALALQAPAGQQAEPAQQDTMFVRVPLRPTKAMTDVTDRDDWAWEDLLAAAEAITAEQYDQIAQVPTGQQATMADSTGAMASAWFGTSAPEAVSRVFAPAGQQSSCPLGCTTECKARMHGSASECPALPNQPPFGQQAEQPAPAGQGRTFATPGLALAHERIAELVEKNGYTGTDQRMNDFIVGLTAAEKIYMDYFASQAERPAQS